MGSTHHLSSLSASYRELQVGVLLPVSEKEREFSKEAVEDIADKLDRRRGRVAGDATLEFCGAHDECLPLLKVVLIFDLQKGY